jgi:hypothetical protein
MEIDRTKILTAVTADQAKVGQKGWFADSISGIRATASRCEPKKLIQINTEDSLHRFMEDANYSWSLFYPAPEPTCRPFANAEEFAPHRDRWVVEKRGSIRHRVTAYGVIHIWLSGQDKGVTRDILFSDYTFEDGTPCGVEVKA